MSICNEVVASQSVIRWLEWHNVYLTRTNTSLQSILPWFFSNEMSLNLAGTKQGNVFFRKKLVRVPSFGAATSCIHWLLKLAKKLFCKVLFSSFSSPSSSLKVAFSHGAEISWRKKSLSLTGNYFEGQSGSFQPAQMIRSWLERSVGLVFLANFGTLDLMP